MKQLFLSMALLCTGIVYAQNNTANNLIEGGKTLVELVKAFKTPRVSTVTAANEPAKTDSCAAKSTSDLCFKNTTGKNIYITLTKRNGGNYESTSVTLKILNKSQECSYELRTGVYRLKIETDGEGDKKVVYREGEIKLNACDNAIKEIKAE